MIWWIVLAVYVIGWAGFSVTTTRFIESGMPSTGALDRAASVFLGMMLAIFWPLVIPGGWVYKRAFSRKPRAD